MAISRRLLMRNTALCAPLLALTACPGTTVSQLAQYAQAAANAGQSVLSQVANAPAALVSAVTALGAAANAVLNAGSAPGASVGQQIYDAAKAVLSVAAPFVSTIPGVPIALAAINAFLPFFAQVAGLAAAVATVAVPGVPAMTPAQALKLYGGA